jgi:hypothetical protein
MHDSKGAKREDKRVLSAAEGDLQKTCTINKLNCQFISVCKGYNFSPAILHKLRSAMALAHIHTQNENYASRHPERHTQPAG